MRRLETTLKPTATDKDDDNTSRSRRSAIVAAVALVVIATLAIGLMMLFRDRSPNYQSVEAVAQALQEAGIPCRDPPTSPNTALPFAREKGSCLFVWKGSVDVRLTIYVFDSSEADRARIGLNNLGNEWYVNGTVAIGPPGPRWDEIIKALES